LALKEPPDVVLSDVNMPRMDGWQFLRMMRSRENLAGVPVIFLTTLSGEEERLKGYQLGVDDYVNKPYRSTELRARVDRLTARMRPSREGDASLHGDLEQVSLGSVLTFLEFERKTGELVVEGELVAKVLLRDGRPLRIEIEGAPPMIPRDLFHTLLDWPTGRFQFNGRDIDVPDDVESTSTAILLEHARISDEEG
jgi:DNA-binding LytR/AlgR family response regulator